MRNSTALPLCLFFVSLLPAEMTVDSAGPVNAASYIPAGLPNSGVARGSIFIVKGTELCASGYTKVDSLPLPGDKGWKGTEVLVTSGGSTLHAYMIYVYGGLKDEAGNTFDQIAALLPSLTPHGNGTLTVRYNGKSVSAPITILQNGPGIFSLNQAGYGPGVITDNILWRANTVTNSFHDRMWVNLWVTGMRPLELGQRDDEEPPIENPTNLAFDLLIAGQPLDRSRINYWGRAPLYPGLDQIQFLPPPGVAGCSIPVAIKIRDFVSNTVTMSLGPNLRCSDPLGPTADEMDRIDRGQPINTGRVALVRVDLKVQTKDEAGNNRTIEGTVDIGHGRFARYEAAYAPFSQELVGLPTAGNCIVRYGVIKNPASWEQLLNVTSDPVPHTALNAGNNLNLTGPGVVATRLLAAPGTATVGPPTSVRITFLNSSNQDAHIFFENELFAASNRLSPGATRQVTVSYARGNRLSFAGGRDGRIIGTGSIVMADDIWSAQVAFDDSTTLKIATTAGPGGDLAMFSTTVTSRYYKLLGAELVGVQFDPDDKIDALFLSGGNVTLQSQAVAGGVGQINTTIAVPASIRLDWPARNSVSEIVRAEGYTVHWSGGNPATDIAVIYGHSVGASTPTMTPGASFVCTANIADGRFAIPPAVLLQIPASRQPHTGIVSVGTAPLNNAGNFTAFGLESGRFTFSQTVVRNVNYK